VKQVINAAESQGVQLLAENALEGGIYDANALQRMLTNSKHFDRQVLRCFSDTSVVICSLPRQPAVSLPRIGVSSLA